MGKDRYLVFLSVILKDILKKILWHNIERLIMYTGVIYMTAVAYRKINVTVLLWDVFV